jgi:hypothetical protein
LTDIEVEKERYYYDPELDKIVPISTNDDIHLPLPADIKTGQATINVPCMP